MKMLVNRETQEMLVGESAGGDENKAYLNHVVQISIVPGQRGMQPLPHVYPGMFTKNFVDEKVLLKREYGFDTNVWAIFDEEEMTQEAIQMYRSVIAEASAGIVLAGANAIPKDARIING
jgi:hypothetical protein